MEMQWRCSKCGGNLGSGVNPPSSCPRCNAKLRSPHRTTDYDSPSYRRPSSQPSKAAPQESSYWGKGVAIAITLLALGCLGMIVMKDWGANHVANLDRR